MESNYIISNRKIAGKAHTCKLNNTLLGVGWQGLNSVHYIYFPKKLMYLKTWLIFQVEKHCFQTLIRFLPVPLTFLPKNIDLYVWVEGEKMWGHHCSGRFQSQRLLVLSRQERVISSLPALCPAPWGEPLGGGTAQCRPPLHCRSSMLQQADTTVNALGAV